VPRLASAGVFLAVGLVLALLPAAKPPAFYESFLYLIFHWIALATSWNILSGYAGYFSFGHGAFFGAGMYTTATLAASFGVPFLWTLPAAGLAAALLGLGIGAVVFRVHRLRGELFALLTLAVTFVLSTIVLNTGIDGGPGVYLSAVPLPRIGGSPTTTIYILGLAVALLSVWTAFAIHRSKFGLGLFAIHNDENVAEVLGVPTYRYKLAAFGLSSLLAGIAGGIHAIFVIYLTVGETFSIIVPLYVVLMSVLGGLRHWAGPAVGAAFVTVLMYAFTGGQGAVLGRAVIGLALILVILFLPEGVLGGLLRRLPARAARPMPAPAGAPAPVQSPLRDRPQGGRTGGAPLLTCADVTKAFRGIHALAGVSLDVRQGEILGLVGPNGSGKSTLINVLSGYYRPDRGRITFQGRDIAGTDAHRIAPLGISRTYQIPRPFAQLTVFDNVAVAGMFGRPGRDRPTAEHEAHQWLRFTALEDKAAAFPGQLNLHQRKFLELARALAAEPRLVLLDEVLSGLTPSEMTDAVKLIREIRERGATVVFVEHVMRAVLDLADRVVVLNYGQVIASGSPREVMRHPEVVKAYLGKSHA
jgi:branched-chain amino acid transport system permease protein